MVVFDPTTFRDAATFAAPKQEPEGMYWVLVNGQLTYDRGRHTDVRAGQLLSFRA